MGILILAVIFIVELLKYWILVNGFLNVQIKRKWIAAVGLVVYVLLSVNEKTKEQDTHLTMYLLVLAITMVTMETKVIHRIRDLLIAMLVISCSDEVFQIPLQYIWNLIQGKMLAEDLKFLSNSLVSLCAIAVLATIKYKTNIFRKEKYLKFVKNMMPILVLILFVVFVFTIGALDFAKDYVQNYKFILFANGIIAVSFISIGFLLVFIMYINSTNKKMEEMLESERNLKEMQLNYYKEMLEREESTRKYRHDMNNHLICLNQLAKKKESDAVIDYLNTMQNHMIEIHKRVYRVGNEIIDAILNYHLSMLHDEVRVDVIGFCKVEILIGNVDVCTILANLVQNAVEELNKTSSNEKFLKIVIKTGSEFMKFEISNTISDRSMEKNEVLRTEKKDRQNHGLGLGNVKKTIEKNDGNFEIKIEDKKFIASVILKNKREN